MATPVPKLNLVANVVAGLFMDVLATLEDSATWLPGSGVNGLPCPVDGAAIPLVGVAEELT